MATRKQTQLISAFLWLGVALAVGFYAYRDFQKTEIEKKQKDVSSRLFAFDKALDPTKEADRSKLLAEISNVSFYNETAPETERTVVAERVEKKHWLIAAPVRTPGATLDIERVLGDVLQAKEENIAKLWIKKIDAKNRAKRLEKYGLAKPKYKLTFTFKGKPHTLELGKKDDFSGHYFAHVVGTRKVVLVTSSIFYALDKKLFDLRLKELFTQRTDDIRTISITRKRDILVFEKHLEPSLQDDGHTDHSAPGHTHDKKPKKTEAAWQILQPIRDLADRNVVNSMISSLKYLRANQFVSENVHKDQEKFGLKLPDILLEVTLQNKKVFTLHVGFKQDKAERKVYVADAQGGPIALVEKNALSDLEKEVFYFRSKRIITFKTDRVKRLGVASAYGSFDLARTESKEDDWRILNPSPQPTTKDSAKNFLTKLFELKASSFIKENAVPADLKTYGLDPADRTYTLYGTSSKEILGVLYLGRSDAGGLYLTNQDKKKIFLISPSDAKDLPEGDWNFLPHGRKPASKPAVRLAPQVPVPPAVPTPAPKAPLPPAPTTPAPKASAPTSAPASQPSPR